MLLHSCDRCSVYKSLKQDVVIWSFSCRYLIQSNTGNTESKSLLMTILLIRIYSDVYMGGAWE